MKYIYPAIFTVEDENILVSVPDLPGLHTFANSMADALFYGAGCNRNVVLGCRKQNGNRTPPYGGYLLRYVKWGQNWYN